MNALVLVVAKLLQLLAWSDWLACEPAGSLQLGSRYPNKWACSQARLVKILCRVAEAYFASWKQQLTLETMFPVWQTEKHWGNMHTPWINIFGISRTSVPGSRVTLTVCKRRLSWTLSVEPPCIGQYRGYPLSLWWFTLLISSNYSSADSSTRLDENETRDRTSTVSFRGGFPAMKLRTTSGPRFMHWAKCRALG